MSGLNGHFQANFSRACGMADGCGFTPELPVHFLGDDNDPWATTPTHWSRCQKPLASFLWDSDGWTGRLGAELSSPGWGFANLRQWVHRIVYPWWHVVENVQNTERWLWREKMPTQPNTVTGDTSVCLLFLFYVHRLSILGGCTHVIQTVSYPVFNSA